MCSLATEPPESGHDGSMRLAPRSLLLLCAPPVAGLACVSTQKLGDPQATGDGSGGVDTSDSAPTEAAETDDESMGSTGVDGSIHDDCIELVWACPSDDLVCLPEGLCVPCAGSGESPASAQGGHCCGGLVQDESGTMCLPDPEPNECLAQGDICGYSGTTQPCCEGSICNPATDLCESDGTAGLEVCGDFSPPPVDCPEEGESTAILVPEIDKGFDFGEDEACSVVSILGESMIGLICDDIFPVFSYESSPALSIPFDVGVDVVYTAVESESPNAEPSVSLHTPEGELLFAYVHDLELGGDLPVDLSPLSVSIFGTGCAGVDASAVICDVEGESIVSARVLVSIEGGDAPLELVTGQSGEVTVDDVTYDVIVAQADRIVCWDDSCAGDESGPWDHLRMLIVAR